MEDFFLFSFSVRTSFLISRSEREDLSWSSFCLHWMHNSKTQTAFESRMGEMIRNQKQKQTKQKTRNPPSDQPHFKFWFPFPICLLSFIFQRLQKAALHILYRWETRSKHNQVCLLHLNWNQKSLNH